jgi:predicted ATPase/class 3 adenylate cyclase
MHHLPTGTVTFLFTDIEGSTKLVQRLGDEFRGILEDHNELLRSAFSAGVEIRMEGDAFFVAFASARHAVEAAIAAQRALAGHDWPEGVRLQVRMGLHTGDGTLGGADYVGVDVHRAARISAAGHGGQILISEATRAALPEGSGLTIRRLGTHRFKDLEAPIEIHQVLAGGLAADFPPIRSIGTPPHNLPTETSGFVGRSREIDDLLKLLETSTFLTLTGPGGVGKTRLALDVARRALHRFADGVYFIALESLTEPMLVPGAIAEQIGLKPEAGVEPIDALVARLADRTTLLVLDNLEQVIDAGPMIARLRAESPGLTVMVTSQEMVRIAGEQVYQVEPMGLPDGTSDDVEHLLESDAVALFVDRATEADPGFAVAPADVGMISGIVTELDGLPLALELAAARLRVLGLAGLHDRISDRFGMLRGGRREAPDRHRTLVGAIEWSHSLLEDAERKAFAELSVAIGGFTLETVEAILDPDLAPDSVDLVESLYDKSLLRRSLDDGVTRFSMLRSIREFAVTELEAAGGLDAATARLARHLARLAEEAAPALESEGQSVWLDRLTAEHDNIRSIVEWALSGGDIDLGLLIAGSIWRFHHRRGHLPEAKRNLEALLAIDGASDRPRAVALAGLASVVYWIGDSHKSVELYLEAVDLFERLGETERVAFCFYGLSTATTLVGDIDAALDYARRAEEAYSACGLEDGVRRVAPAIAFASWMAGHLEVAAEQWERAANMFHEAGDVAEELQTCVARAIVDYQLGRDGIPQRVRGCVEAMVDYGDVTGTLMALEFFARVIVSSEPETAVRIAGGARTLRSQLGGGHTPETVGLTSTWEEAARSLGTERVATASAEGERLDLDALVHVALSVGLNGEGDAA